MDGHKCRRLKKKDDTIDRLHTKVDTLLKNNKKMDNRIKLLLKKNDKIYHQNQDIENKLDTVTNDRVVPTYNKRDTHMLIIIKNNADPDEYDDDEIIYDYYVLRVMKKSYSTRLNEHLDRYPEMEIKLKISFSPNSMNLWNRVKKKLRKKLDTSRCGFNLKKGLTEKQLIKTIQKIHNERFDTEDI